MEKIESNLLPDITTFEAILKEKQMSLSIYESITNKAINSSAFNSITSNSTWDSKWPVDSTTVNLGIRREWQDEKGALIGIDLCKFDSEFFADKAVTIRNDNIGIVNCKIDLKTLATDLEKIREKWITLGIDDSASIVGTINNFAVHIYTFDSSGINTTYISSIINELAEQLNNL